MPFPFPNRTMVRKDRPQRPMPNPAAAGGQPGQDPPGINRRDLLLSVLGNAGQALTNWNHSYAGQPVDVSGMTQRLLSQRNEQAEAQAERQRQDQLRQEEWQREDQIRGQDREWHEEDLDARQEAARRMAEFKAELEAEQRERDYEFRGGESEMDRELRRQQLEQQSQYQMGGLEERGRHNRAMEGIAGARESRMAQDPGGPAGPNRTEVSVRQDILDRTTGSEAEFISRMSGIPVEVFEQNPHQLMRALELYMTGGPEALRQLSPTARKNIPSGQPAGGGGDSGDPLGLR